MGSIGRTTGEGGGQSAQQTNKLSSYLSDTNRNTEFEVTQELESMPVGTRIYDGSSTITAGLGSTPTYYEKTSKYGWTLLGDTNNYDSTTSNRVAKQLERKKRNAKFSLRVR